MKFINAPGEIGRHKGLKSRDSQEVKSIEVKGSLKHPIKSHNLKFFQLRLENKA